MKKEISNLRERMDEDAKKALETRVGELENKYDYDSVERIIFTEIESIGLKSEFYMDLLDLVIDECKLKRNAGTPNLEVEGTDSID